MELYDNAASPYAFKVRAVLYEKGLAIEHQWRHRPATRTELVAAGDTDRREHRVAEPAQPLDVPAHGAHRHAEAGGELRTGPVRAALEQRQELEQAAGRARGSVVHAGTF